MRITNFFATIALTLLLVWLLGFAVYVTTSLDMKPQEPATKTDAIIILTGGNHRIDTGLELFANDMAPNVFISGVFPDTTLSTILKTSPLEIEKDKCCIELGYQARSTEENATETKEWIKKNGVKSIRLVTSNYHMHRAHLELSAANPDIQIISHPVQKKDYTLEDLRFWEIIFMEYHKSLFRGLTHFLQLNQKESS